MTATIHPLDPAHRPHTPAKPSPRRSGLPWTTADHEAMADAAAKGQNLKQIAATLGRTEAAVIGRLRRLLPTDERRCPQELVAVRLHEIFTADPDYDWREVMIKDAPVSKPADIVRTGLNGLTDDQLAYLAYAALVADTVDADSTGIGRELIVTACRRGLKQEILDLRVNQVRRCGHHLIAYGEEQQQANDWLRASRLWSDEAAHQRYRYWTAQMDEPY